MGLGMGIFCERCDDQISYDMRGYQLKDDGDEFNLCGKCAHIVVFEKRTRIKEE